MSVGVETRTSDYPRHPYFRIAALGGAAAGERSSGQLVRLINGRAWRRGSELGFYGRGRTCCPEGRPLKAFDQSHWLVSNPRLPRRSRRPLWKAETSETKQMLDRGYFLEPSPYEADGGHLIGRDPRQIPLAEIRQLQHPESPIKAIRAKCIDCSGGNAAEARKCTAVNCPLWPMRMAVSPFHASSRSAKLQVANFATSSATGGVA